MSKEIQKNLMLTAAKVFVAKKADLPELAHNLSNAQEVVDACDKLITDQKAKRIGSVIDVKLTIGQGDSMEVKCDDNGTILKSQKPEAKITGSWYETLNFDPIKEFLNIKVIDVPSGSGVDKAYTIAGQKISPTAMPECVVILQGIEQDNASQVNAYITGSVFSGELIFSFVDHVRTNGLENSSFEFVSNDGSGWLVKKFAQS